MKKRILLILFFGLILAGLVFISIKDINITGKQTNPLRAKVTKIMKTTENLDQADDGIVTQYIFFKAKVKSGETKEKTVNGYQMIVNSDTNLKVERVEKGDHVYLDSSSVKQTGMYTLLYYERFGTLILLASLLFLFLLIFGKKKGFLSIISLLYTIIAVCLVFIPALLSDKNPIIWGLITSIYIVVSSLMIMNGKHKKTLCGILGCIGGMIMVILLSLLSIKLAKLTGGAGDAIYLKQLHTALDFKLILISTFLIGSIGAIMDVAVELSASLYEIWEKAKDNSIKSIISSGFNIGRDMIGTMSNTLVLAYISCAFVSLANAINQGWSIGYIISSEFICDELIQILTGSLGILTTIPLTTIICALIYNKKLSRKS